MINKHFDYFNFPEKNLIFCHYQIIPLFILHFMLCKLVEHVIQSKLICQNSKGVNYTVWQLLIISALTFINNVINNCQTVKFIFLTILVEKFKKIIKIMKIVIVMDLKFSFSITTVSLFLKLCCSRIFDQIDNFRFFFNVN